jgi:hypothetical protein
MQNTLRQLNADLEVIKLQHLLSSQGYFKETTPSHGIFENVTHDNVVLFQLQHIDIHGVPLEADGIVGPSTWWALNNPSGEGQRNHFKPIIPGGLTESRERLVELIFEEHDESVLEVPDGSNRSNNIDLYWGDTGVLGLPWCCAFVSWALFETLGHYPIGGKHHLGVQKMWREASRLGFKSDSPKPGDIFIQIKANGKGHTGFVVGISKDGSRIYTCEGNCGNRLKIGKRNMSSINHYIDCMDDNQGNEFERLDFDVRNVSREGTR